MKKIVALSLSLLMLLSVAGCAKEAPKATEGDSASSDAIVVGVVAPLSGGAAMVGDTLVKGVDLAVKEINAAGGINGRPIKIVKEDDEQNPAKSVSAMNKLVHSDKVSAVIGTVNSSCTMANMEVTRAAGIPQVTPIASGPAITNSGNDFIVRVQASDLLMAEAIANYVSKDLGLKKIAIMYQSDDYGTGGKDVA
ncbi:MAG: ABC transporter substrate-binding protein, partial [Angelakisella sp.]